LQCVAVCCSVLQCVADSHSTVPLHLRSKSVLQWIAVRYSVSQRMFSYATLCCSEWQCAAVCCRLLQCVAVCCNVLQCVATCCSVLQCAATLYSVLQFFVFPAATTAVCRSVLQCYAVCCSSLSVLLQLGAKSAHTHATNESCHTYKHHTTRINQSWHTCSRSSCGVLVGKNFDCVCATVRSYGVLKDKNTYTIEVLAGF